MADQEKQQGRSASDESKAVEGLTGMASGADKEWLAVAKRELAKVGITTFIDSARDITTGVVEVKVFDPTRKQERVYKFDPSQEKQLRNLLSDFLRKYGDGYREIFRHHKLSIDELVPSQPESVPEITFKQAINESVIRDRGDRTADDAPQSEQAPLDESAQKVGPENTEEVVAEQEVGEPEKNLEEVTFSRLEADDVIKEIVSLIPEGMRIRISHVTNRATGEKAKNSRDAILRNPDSISEYLSKYLTAEFNEFDNKSDLIKNVQIAVATDDEGNLFLSAEYQSKKKPEDGFFFRNYALKLTAIPPREAKSTGEPAEAEELIVNEEVPFTEAHAAKIISEIGKQLVMSTQAEGERETATPPEQAIGLVKQLAGSPSNSIVRLEDGSYKITETITRVTRRFLRKPKETTETNVYTLRVDQKKDLGAISKGAGRRHIERDHG